jgi:hypothetical protein
MDHSHLEAITQRLNNERARLASARTDAERRMRRVWVEGIEKERAAEMQFLGIDPAIDAMTDEELLAALDA